MQDGVAFTTAVATGRRSTQLPRANGSIGGGSPPPKKKTKKTKNEEAKEKKKFIKKARGASKMPLDSHTELDGGSGGAIGAPLLGSSVQEPALQASVGSGSASNTGGSSGYRGDEWMAPKVVLSSGARETGVKVKM